MNTVNSGAERLGRPGMLSTSIVTSTLERGIWPVTNRKPASESAADVEISLTIIIPSYNTRELLADCLRSIYEAPPVDAYEIIVIDDASKDGTSEMVRSCFPEVRLLRNEINRHYAYSNNWAFSVSRGQYLLLLNSDTIVLSGALDDMLAFLRLHPDAGVVGCKLINEDGTTQWSVKSLPNLGAALFGARSIISKLFPNNPWTRMHLLHLGRDMTTPFLVVSGYVSSACFMVPHEVVDNVGGLDLRLAYHVDADYCKRISDAGYNCYYLPAATVMHLNHKGGTMAGPSARFRSLMMFEHHSYIYYRKHLNRSIWSPMQIAVAIGLFSHLLLLMTAQVWSEVSTRFGTTMQAKEPSHNVKTGQTGRGNDKSE